MPHCCWYTLLSPWFLRCGEIGPSKASSFSELTLLTSQIITSNFVPEMHHELDPPDGFLPFLLASNYIYVFTAWFYFLYDNISLPISFLLPALRCCVNPTLISLSHLGSFHVSLIPAHPWPPTSAYHLAGQWQASDHKPSKSLCTKR